nr:DsbA family protein [Paracoccaceae bacterium]
MAASSQAHLLYVADPMCSWCWGFAPVIADIRAAFRDRLPLHLVMGGLRPGTS